MKKLIALVLALVCVLVLAGCQEQVLTCSFRGEHEYFAISNGSITMEDKEAVFDGGIIEITQSGFFDEVASYTTTFYTLTNGEQKHFKGFSRLKYFCENREEICRASERSE